MVDANALHQALGKGRINWRRHALERMLQRGISRNDVKAVLGLADQIEQYRQDYPFPSALFFGRLRGKVLHVVAAVDAEGPNVYVISAYWPDSLHFEDDMRARRRQR